MGHRIWLLPFAGCLLAVWSAAQAVPPPVVEIAFEGNRVTRASVLRQELLIREGDPADPEAIEASRQSLMNLGLFKDVRADTTPVEDGVVLTYRLTEKYFYFVLPRLSRSADGDLRYGGEVRADNVFGLNHRLRLRFDIDEAASGTEQRDERLSLKAGTRGKGTRAKGIRAAPLVPLPLYLVPASYPPVIDMKRRTFSGRSRNSWRSGLRSTARWMASSSSSSLHPARSRGRNSRLCSWPRQV